jgi:hypothetical protein
LYSKIEIKNRLWILSKLHESPNQELSLTGYLNMNNASNWVTFTQIENKDSIRIAGHLNFPIHKVRKILPNYNTFNHKQFIIKGKPSFYVSNGTKRGCIILNNLSLKYN